MTELALFFGLLNKIGFGHKVVEILLTFFFTLILVLVLLWLVRKPLAKFGLAIYKAMEAVPKMEESIEKLNNTLQEHIVQTDLRMTEGENKFTHMHLEIEKLKSHVGIK